MRWFTWVTAAIGLLSMLLLTAALIAGRTLNSKGEIIVYQSEHKAVTDIYLYDVQTGVTHNLTRQRRRSQLTQRLLTDGDTADYPTQPQQFISQGSNISPAISPDGRQLAFVSYRDGNPKIYLLDLRTGELRNLTNYPGMDTSPVWSPDSTKLAFESLRNGYWGIWLIDLETGELAALTDQPIASQSPAWSPDSRQIAFQGKRGRYWDIYLFDLESGQSHNLTNATRDDLNPAWAGRP